MVRPGCPHTDWLLDQARAARPLAGIETIEVFQQPLRAVRDRVFMIPAIVLERKRWFHAPALTEILKALDEKSEGSYG